MNGKLYKALCSACTKPKDRRPALEKPWYSPAINAVVATNTYMIIALDYDAGGESAPCVYHGDTAHVLAKDEVGFDAPIEREPIAACNVTSCLSGIDNRGRECYDPQYLEPVVKVAKAGGYKVKFEFEEGKVMRGYYYDGATPVGRFVVMSCGIDKRN